MTERNTSGPLIHLRVGTKITLIALFFLLAIASIVAFTVSTVEKQDEDAILIELVGRQRMLQKQHLAQTFLRAQQPGNNEDLNYTRKVWLDSQAALIRGGEAIARLNQTEVVKLPPAPTDAIRSKLQEQQELIEQAIKASERYLANAGTADAAKASTTLEQLMAIEERLQAVATDNAKAITAYSQERARSLIRTEITIGVGSALLGLLFSWLISRGITGPLARVVQSAESVAQGNLRIEKLGFDRQDELGQLARAFDNMLENLKALSGQIGMVTGNVNASSAEILASTQQQASSTKEQAATVQEISTTMQEISQAGQEISERAKQVAASAEATSTASTAGITAVQNTNRLMEGIGQQVEEVATRIVALSEKTQAIGEIISTVNDIAEQSNLLALNASIEAASAGEHGSRFAVVASEMRNLAERAKESTVQVGSLLSEIQKGINSSVMLAEEAVKRTDSGKHQAEVTENTIHQMMNTTVDSINAFQQIVGGINQQQIGLAQVTQGMRDIRQAAEQNAIGTSQLEKAVSNLNELSAQLRTAVERYRL